ncbi:Ger(x)C family spore germination protein [Paenibacillus sp. QZ-Y1]|uniref:Ger(x)C family spore germination protein n=1 Tax=Paenibacillus sp. QZ-Y1 TaxID=3414511 RepID=UPI003F7A0E7D
MTACWDRVEINDIAIVLATGIDHVDEKVHLTAQIFIPRKGGGGAESGGSSPSGVTMIRTAEGRTVAEALNRLQRQVARNMFWGHCEVYYYARRDQARGRIIFDPSDRKQDIADPAYHKQGVEHADSDRIPRRSCIEYYG